MHRGSHAARRPARAVLATAGGACLFLLFLLSAASPARAQTTEVKISVVSLSPPRVRVEGTRAAPTKSWSFLNVYGGVMGLGGRVENFSLTDAARAAVASRRLAPGEFEAEREAAHFSYELKLDPPQRATDAAHVSWLTEERGLLLLADLLPRPVGTVRVRFVMPEGWTVASGERADAAGRYELSDVGDAVFLAGRDVRSRQQRGGGVELTSVAAGPWAFTDEDLARTAGDVLKDHEKMLGGSPRARAAVLVLPFPRAASAQAWSAETRGGSVVLLSGQWPSKAIALSRLDGVLSHELLHLWVPNALSLDGDYGWFYEGFTLYLSLRAGVRRGQLTFQDYLNAVGRAYDGYRAGRGAQNLSLVEASRRRWSLSPSLVYDHGLLAAFLCDLTLLQRTGRKQGLEDAYRAVFRQHGPGRAREDGNRAVIKTLKGFAGLDEVVARHVESATAIDLATEVAPFGLRLERAGPRTQLVVAPDLSKPQGELLRELGYNDRDDSATRRLREKLRRNLR